MQRDQSLVKDKPEIKTSAGTLKSRHIMKADSDCHILPALPKSQADNKPSCWPKTVMVRYLPDRAGGPLDTDSCQEQRPY